MSSPSSDTEKLLRASPPDFPAADDGQHLASVGSSDSDAGAVTSLSDSLDNHREVWPPAVTGGRISLSPPENLENILEVSPSAADFKPSDEPESDSTDSTGVYQSTTAPKHSPDDSDMFSSTTSPPTSCDSGIDSSCASRGRVGQWIHRMKHALEQLNFNRRQVVMVSVLAVVTLTSSFAVCLFPPFFPKIAQSKGCSITVFGLIIGTNCLVAFLVTPTVGKNLEKIGVKFSFVVGAMASGGCCILSGFLEWFPPGWEFVLDAVLIRAVHACSNAFVITSTFAFIVVEFPNNIAKLFAMTRTTMNLAQMLGPVVGGALYEVGGFKMPFLVLGSVQIVVAFGCIYALPSYRQKPIPEGQLPHREVSLRDVLRIPGMWISFCTFIFSTMSNGFLSITLEPLVLRKFDISHLHVGFLFGLKDGANSLASPFWGYLCDRYKCLRVFILVSTVMAAGSFVLLGPMPGLPIETTHTVVVIALIINGFGIGGQQVAGVVHAMNMAVDAKLPDDAATHGFVAGLWSSLSGAGRFISRAGSGFVTDQIGFQYSSMIVVFLHCIVFIVTLSFILLERSGVCKCCPPPKKDEIDGEPQGDGDQTPPRQPNKIILCTTTPSEPICSKAINVPSMRDTLEGAMNYGSMGSLSKSPAKFQCPPLVEVLSSPPS